MITGNFQRSFLINHGVQSNKLGLVVSLSLFFASPLSADTNLSSPIALCSSQILEAALVQPTIKAGIVVVVDPISEGKFLAKAIRRRGLTPYFIFTKQTFLNGGEKYFDASEFDGGFHMLPDGEKAADYDQVLNSLQNLSLPVVGVIAGTETAPKVTAQLAADLGVLGNDVTKADAWLDKIQLGEWLAKADEPIRTPKSTVAKNELQALSWTESTYGEWPVVVKPRDGMGSFGVFLCYTPADLKKAFQLIGSPSPRGGTIEELMVQEFIDPKDANLFIVEVAASEGEYKIGFNLQYDLKRVEGFALTWNYTDMLPPTGEVADILADVAIRASKAVGITTGVSHWEIFLKREKGKLVPIVLDLGARTGGGMHSFTSLGTTQDITEVDITAHLDPETFRALPERYEQTAHVRLVGLNVEEAGMTLAKAETIRARLSKIDSFKEYRPFGPDGKTLGKTTDLFSMAGWVFLAGKDKADVERDYQKITELVESGLFFAHPPSPTLKTREWGFPELTPASSFDKNNRPQGSAVGAITYSISSE